MPTRTSASLPPWTLASPAAATVSAQQVGVSRHIAFVRCLTPLHAPHDTPWLVACYRLTPHLQRLTQDTALLDLGLCADTEAVGVIQGLLAHLRDKQVSMRAAIGPSAVLAQLALLRLSPDEEITLVTRDTAHHLLQALPVGALMRLRLSGGALISPSALAALDGYGIRTLAQLAQLGEERLRQHFGARLGTALAAVTCGEDLLPLQPTPAPERLHIRLRLTASVPADHLLLRLPHFTVEIAAKLARRGLQARTIALRLRWESGAVQTVSRVLPQPLAESRSLADLLHRLLAPLVQAQPESQRRIDDLLLTLADLTTLYPAQHSFWPQRAMRLATAYEIAGVLARRHGKPLLFHARPALPDAIFELDGTRLTPINADVEPDTIPGLEMRASGRARAGDVANRGEYGEAIPHGVHWW